MSELNYEANLLNDMDKEIKSKDKKSNESLEEDDFLGNEKLEVSEDENEEENNNGKNDDNSLQVENITKTSQQPITENIEANEDSTEYLSRRKKLAQLVNSDSKEELHVTRRIARLVDSESEEEEELQERASPQVNEKKTKKIKQTHKTKIYDSEDDNDHSSEEISKTEKNNESNGELSKDIKSQKNNQTRISTLIDTDSSDMSDHETAPGANLSHNNTEIDASSLQSHKAKDKTKKPKRVSK